MKNAVLVSGAVQADDKGGHELWDIFIDKGTDEILIETKFKSGIQFEQVRVTTRSLQSVTYHFDFDKYYCVLSSVTLFYIAAYAFIVHNQVWCFRKIVILTLT